MKLLSLFSSNGYGKNIYVKVTTMDADLERVLIEPDWTGRQLFDTVCRIIGLREIWYFGLQFINKKQIPCWLQMENKVCKQDVPRQEDGTMQFLFLVKFYPEDVEEELIQDITRHLFFLQINQSILSMDLYCSAEASVLLASYAVQAIHGDCNGDVALELQKLLPKSVIDQYDMSEEMWEERIRRWWINNNGQSREDAEMEYLRVAQDLEMYGIQYFPICNAKETDLRLGVSAQGVGIYKDSNRITPRPFFSWSEIKNISFQKKVFCMKTLDKSAITFRAQDMSINMSILDLCIGTHNLYLRRRQPDLLEVQQMKAQAKEERQRRQHEHTRLAMEREQRQAAEADRDRLKMEIASLSDQLNSLQESMKRTEEAADLLSEKARLSEEESLVLSKRASEAEAECQRMKISQIKTEETKMVLERKAREAELIAARLMQESERRARDAQMYRNHLLAADSGFQNWAMYPYNDHTLIANQLSGTMNGSASGSDSTASSAAFYGSPDSGGHFRSAPPIPPDPATGHYFTQDISSLKAEIEKGRNEYKEKSRSFKEKLTEFRAEIDGLKIDDRQSDHDRIHNNNLHAGDDKYSTLRKSRSDDGLMNTAHEEVLYYSAAGSAKSRVQVFDGL